MSATDLRLCAFLAHSLDAKIAGPNGELDWLDRLNERIPAGEDCGFAAFVGSMDALLMGRKTFEKVLEFGFWPYTLPVFVLGQNFGNYKLPQAEISLLNDGLQAALEQLASLGHRQIYVDGGTLISSCLGAGLMDELILTQVPILLGSGIDLFRLGNAQELSLNWTKQWPFGYIQSSYKVLKG